MTQALIFDSCDESTTSRQFGPG